MSGDQVLSVLKAAKFNEEETQCAYAIYAYVEMFNELNKVEFEASQSTIRVDFILPYELDDDFQQKITHNMLYQMFVAKGISAIPTNVQFEENSASETELTIEVQTRADPMERRPDYTVPEDYYAL